MNSSLHWLTTAFGGIVGFLPNLVGGLLILLLGYVIGRVLARIVRAVGTRVGFDRAIARLGFQSRSNDYDPDARTPSYWLGSAVFFVVMLATIMQAARTLNLTFVATGIASFIGYLPHVFGAAVVFAAALYVGNWVRDRLARARPDSAFGSAAGSRVLPSAVRGVILALGSFMALRELQIAPEIVNAAFIVTLGAIGLASALAFGLGARDVAGRIAQSWYDRRPRGPGRASDISYTAAEEE